MQLRNLEGIFEEQRRFFLDGSTFSIKFRKEQLKKLMSAIKQKEPHILAALKTDLSKPEFEAYSNEIGLVYSEIKHTLRHLSKWSKTERTRLELYLLPGRGYIQKDPYGSVLIIAPWNYPFQLVIAPLISAIAAGNTVILKPSELAPSTAEVLTELMESTFDREYISVINGGVTETTELLNLPFNKIFFTGSVPVGKIVMEAASKHLTPVTLELGGKSPVIADKTANLKIAAKKIVFGRFNNAGQTCVAPDYLLVEKSISKELISLMIESIKEFFGSDPKASTYYGRIINERHFNRLIKLIDPDKVIYGGDSDSAEKYIGPTIMTDVELDDEVMQNEIFGPILPVMEYENIEDAITVIRSFPKPLALYLFTTDRKTEKHILKRVPFGGGGINSTLMHVASSYLPIGGVGHSGTGSYHGKAGFDEFSHSKSVLKQPAGFDPGIAYPGKQLPLWLIKKLMG